MNNQKATNRISKLMLALVMMGSILSACLPTGTPNGLATQQEVEARAHLTTQVALASAQAQAQTATAPPTLTKVPLTTTSTIMPSDTPTPSATFTQVVPTLSVEQQIEFVLFQLKQATVCQLPCWWDVQPGIRVWGEVGDFYYGNGIKPQKYKNTYEVHWRIPYKNKTIGLGVIYYLKSATNPIIDVIVIGAQMSNENSLIFSDEIFEFLPMFRVDAMLSMYGKPDTIQIYTSGIGNEYGQIFFGIELYYSSLGIRIQYTGTAVVQGNDFLFCPRNQSFDAVLLWNPVETDNSVLMQSSGNYFISKSIGKDLSEVTELQIEDFFDMYVEPQSSRCLSTPMQHWLP